MNSLSGDQVDELPMVPHTGQDVIVPSVCSSFCMGCDLLFVFNYGYFYQILMRISLDCAELYVLIDICRRVVTYAVEGKL